MINIEVNMNQEIHYDYHSRNDVEFYYHIDTRTGYKTCQAFCEHCYFRSTEAAGFRQNVGEAQTIMDNLRSIGFKVVPVVPDSFGDGGSYLKTDIFKNTNFIMGNMAWTSGVPLVSGNYQDLLRLLVKSNIALVAMTSHGISDYESPFQGVTKPSVVKQAVALIKNFNKEFSQSIQVSLIFTIGKWNCNYETVGKYFNYCEELGVNILRVNQFIDCSSTYSHSHHMLSKEGVIEAYKILKALNNQHQENLRLSVSEDFGKWGVEIMGFPKDVGDCPSGKNLFGIVYPKIYVCPVKLIIVAGTINKAGEVIWDHTVLSQVEEAKKSEHYSGCFGVSYARSLDFRKFFTDKNSRHEC